MGRRSPDRGTERSTRNAFLLLLLAAAVAGASIWYVRRAQRPGILLREGEIAFEHGDFPTAARLARHVLELQPDSLPARLLACQALRMKGDVDGALEHLHAAEGLANPGDRRDFWQLEVEILVGADRLALAEAPLRNLLALPRAAPESAKILAAILQLEGRRWDANPWLMQLVRSGVANLNHLSYLGAPEAMAIERAEVERTIAGAGDCLLPLIGLARVEYAEENYAQAETLLRRVVAEHPDSVEAWAQLGHLLAQTGQVDQSVAWSEACPDRAREHPYFWIALGTTYTQLREEDAAVQCYWEALRREPHHQYANLQIAALLRRRGNAALAKSFEIQRERLRQTVPKILRLAHHPSDAETTIEVAAGMESLGRLWEAWAWWGRVLELNPSDAAAAARRAALQPRLSAELPQTLPEFVPALALDYSAKPLPPLVPLVHRVVRRSDLGAAGQGSQPATDDRVALDSLDRVSFAEMTQSVGLDFTYYNAPDASTRGERMQETVGGGAGALDYDGDGWPDLYFTQGCEWPPQGEGTQYLDRLYRNEAGLRATDVTAAAGLHDTGFGQGIACGDFNVDGFADFYVANIGANTLWENRGDGTFTARPLPPAGEPLTWTTSCLLADLNADGLPDICDVNYLTGSDVYDRICQGFACSPSEFLPARDRLLLNAGDDGFFDLTDEVGFPENDGYGLGAVAWPDDDSGRLNLFIANDQMNNLFLVQQDRTRGGPVRWADEGVVSGLAFDAEGRPQACMGVATDDADGDGELDLFVTNFYQESNALYLYQARHSYLDATRPAGLRGPSFRMVGFGTQFLDADLDGWPDLVLTNGHIGERLANEPYRMRPQFMYNLGGAKFVEIPAEQLGPFFVAEHLGRGLAKLDFDRDGKEDFAVSHLHEPAALVRNATEQTGHSLRLQLRGVASNRDALGAVLTIRTQERTIKKFMTAGGGYMACNEMQIVAGLGPETEVQELSILWPSGVTQSCGPLPADTRLLWVEGRATPLVMPLE